MVALQLVCPLTSYEHLGVSIFGCNEKAHCKHLHENLCLYICCHKNISLVISLPIVSQGHGVNRKKLIAAIVFFTQTKTFSGFPLY